jgi:nucleoid-associated protein YgaU
VEENENLTLIAKRYYGDAEGNRKINCDRIFEANRDQLASPDKVCVGQRLIIPPLRGNLTLADVCVPVSPVPPRDTASPTPATSARPRFYEVKEGDCLSKIAAAVLGNGRRYQELIQLNQDLLPDEDSLTVGTRLRLPTN